jgi:hypothetical protein
MGLYLLCPPSLPAEPTALPGIVKRREMGEDKEGRKQRFKNTHTYTHKRRKGEKSR